MTITTPASDAAAAAASEPAPAEPLLGEGLRSRAARWGSPIRDLPGGAFAEEEWSGEDRVTLRITGELDAFDRNALIDLLTGCFVEGAREILIDAGGVRFADLDVIQTLVRLATGLERLGGTMEILGLDRVRELMLRLPSGEPHQDFTLGG
jgi:anti-anti-sigma regulatory factor